MDTFKIWKCVSLNEGFTLVKDTNTTVTGNFFFFFFFTWSQNLHPVVLKKGAPKQRFLQRKDNNIKVTGTFFFFIRSQNLHPVVLNKGAPKQRFLQRKSYRNIFLFHLKPIFVSLFFKRRCPKGDVLLF